MSRFVASTVDALRAAATADPARPLITYYDDATGERTELSAATLDNWVAKTANLLVDGLALGRGDTATVLLPPHWQTAAVLLGCWSAGLAVTGSGGDVAFVSEDLLGTPEANAPDVYVLALAPLAAPMRPGPPPGVADYVIEVRAHGDRFASAAKAQDPATPTQTQGQLCRRAAQRGVELGVASGARVLVDGDVVADPVDWLLAPLAAGASIVLCRNFERGRLAERVAAERVTLTLAP